MSIAIESPYSFNGSLIKYKDLETIKSFGYQTLGLVDTSSAFFYTFYKFCIDSNIKPILGLRFKNDYYDLIIYPINYSGYKELLKYKSDLNIGNIKDMIYSNDLIYCFDITYLDPLNLKIVDNEYINLVNKKLDVYFGINILYYPAEIALYPLVKDKYKCVFLNHTKYIDKKDEKASRVLDAIINNKELNDSNLFSFEESDCCHILSKEEYVSIYKDFPELVKNQKELTDKVNLVIELEDYLPKYINKENLDSATYLKLLSNAGLKKRLLNKNVDKNKYKERLNYELDVIHKMGFDDYFLVVYDYILYAKKSGIYVGPGRGSSASSLVSYSLGIIDIDPIEYNLYFERFLNPSRATMPDIDTDFEDTRRNEVIKYCQEKYGTYNVSLIATYQTFLAKSSLTEVSKALNIDPRITSILTSLIDDKHNELLPLLDNTRIKNQYDKNQELKEIIDIALKIEGLPRSIGTHASGVIISSNDLREISEIDESINGFYQTVYDSDTLKYLGLLKMDFLSLKNLSTLKEIVESINSFEKNLIDINNIPLNDNLTYQLLKNVNVSGIFQLESEGMKELLRKIRIENFDDLVLSIALYRPGPREQIPEYLKRRNGESKIDYYDDSLKDILKDTLGVIVYQEQLMAVCQKYSGLSLAEADILRRAISAKDKDMILELKDKFYKGANDLNRNKLITERIFNDIFKFAEYGFNKAHSVAYSYIAYKLAYLKAHYPNEFMISLLESSSTTKYLKECQKNRIKVLPPDFRFSSYKYNIVDKTIYMPFNIIKGIGVDYAKSIESLKSGDVSFESVVSRAKGIIPRSILEDLIFASSFDFTGYNKKTMIESLDGLFEFNPNLIKGLNYKIKKVDEFDFNYLKNKEFELLGFNFKYHPLKLVKSELPRLSDLNKEYDNVSIISYITDIRTIKTKTNDTMVSMYIEDEFMQSRAVMFSREYYRYAHELKENTIYEINGSYRKNREELEFIIRTIKEVNV